MSSVAANSLDPASAVLLEIRGVAKRFGAREVLRNISLNIAEGEFLALLGESGSGKTTLLRLVAGFEEPTAGEIWMSGERLDLLPPYQRRVNTVFQNYALFPHLSVRENVAYGLRVKKTAATEINGRVEVAPEAGTAHIFIGQTNLLRGEVLDGMARCGAIAWPSDDPGGAAIFSLRPEAIRLASDAVARPGTARFRAALEQQFFSGASELLEVNCSGQLLRVRISARGPLSGEHEFVFSTADAIRVQE